MTAPLIALVVATAGLASQGGPAPAVARPAIAAEAGGVQVSVAEVRDALIAARQTGDPRAILATMTAEGVERVARAVLERKLLSLEARRQGLDKTPAVARALDRAVETALADALVARTQAAVDTSEAALRQYYAARSDEFRTGPRRKAHHIVVSTETEIEAVRAELAAGRAFDDIAAARNIDNSKAGRGDLGWVARGVMVKPFDEALFALTRPGQVSPVVRTEFGYHLIRIDDVDPGSLPPFELIKDRVAEAAAARAVAELTAELLAAHPAVVHSDALATLMPGAPR